MHRSHVIASLALALFALGGADRAVAQSAVPALPAFSTAKPGTAPAPWQTVKINERKKLTVYNVVEMGPDRVLHANATGSASALGVPVNFDLKSAPVLTWRWRVAGLIDGADNSIASKEDSPARVMLEFDGDKSKLSFSDRTSASIAGNLAGREFPYATLMYVWANSAPVGTVIPNPHTKRVQMIVVSSGASGVGQWQTLKRNMREDYKRAFGEEPGLLKSISVMTDTDNTDSKVEAWYGDLRLQPD